MSQQHQAEIQLNHRNSQRRPICTEVDYKQPSLRNQSLKSLQHKQQSQVKIYASAFFEEYKPKDPNFPLRTLISSTYLTMKKYGNGYFYGQLRSQLRYGVGVMVYNDNRVYEGEWKDDNKQGFGVEMFTNGCSYKGDYKKNKPYGFGCFSWPNGQYYDGQWVEGIRQGSGMWRGVQGDSYKGQWRQDRPEGYGVHTSLKGDTYEGQFKDSLKHGKGIQRFANGDIFRGNYQCGKAQGYGQYYWVNGSHFKGQFQNGLRNGKGVWKRSKQKNSQYSIRKKRVNSQQDTTKKRVESQLGISKFNTFKGEQKGDSYEGYYKQDKKWGQGVFRWASGNFYKGSYQADTRSGYGQMYWKNGGYYKGEWLKGIQHGEGQLFLPGMGYKRGLFQNNVITQVWEQRLTQVKPKHPIKSHFRTSTEKKEVQQSRQKPVRRRKTQTNYMTPVNKHTPSLKQWRSSYQHSSPLKLPRTTKNHTQTQYQVQMSSNLQIQTKYGNRMGPLRQTKAKVCKKHLYASFNHMAAKHSHQSFAAKKKCEWDQRQKQISQDRLLHSSFYLHKLNVMHNIETRKFIAKQQRKEQQSQMLKQQQQQSPSLLFLGRLEAQQYQRKANSKAKLDEIIVSNKSRV